MNKRHKILVIGSEGAVGPAIFDVLNSSKNNLVFRLGRSRLVRDFNEDNFLNVDLTDLHSCRNIGEKYRFDVVIYLAGAWHGKNLKISNLIENLSPFNNFLNTIAKSSKHIIYFSSSTVYGAHTGYKETLLDEMPDSSYGVSKLLSEHLLVDFCIKNTKPYTIFRPFHITSPFEKYNPGRSHVVTDFINKLSNRIELNRDGFDTIWIPFTWAFDIGLVLTNCIGNTDAYDQVFNLGSSYSYSLAQLERIIVNTMFGKDYNQKENFDLTPRNVEYFEKLNGILGGYSFTKLPEMVSKFILYNNMGR